MQRGAGQQIARYIFRSLADTVHKETGCCKASAGCGFATVPKQYGEITSSCHQSCWQSCLPKEASQSTWKQALNQQHSSPARLWGVRWQSTSPDIKAAQQRASQMVAEGKATARSSVSRASASVLDRLPTKARKLITDAQQPGNLQRALKLQLEAFWGNHSRKILAIGGVFVVYALWRSLFGFASMFFKLSETMADFGFLALAAAMASFGFLYVRRLYTINPDSVYRKAMLQLNTNPAILEVMGAPVAGSNVRATVTTGGGLRMKGLQPKLRSRRVQMIFPLTGSERRGLVSLEAKKLQGRYLFKLLAIDVPTASGAEQRLFVEGDEKAYSRGGVIAELRDPFLQALSLKEANELEDEIDDAAADADAEQLKRAKKAAKLKAEPKPLDEGGGMYFHERAWLGLRKALSPTPAGTTLPLTHSTARAVPTPPSPLKAQAAADLGLIPKNDKPKSPAEAGETLDPGIIPTSPTGDEADKLHQYKKEASSQQAP